MDAILDFTPFFQSPITLNFAVRFCFPLSEFAVKTLTKTALRVLLRHYVSCLDYEASKMGIVRKKMAILPTLTPYSIEMEHDVLTQLNDKCLSASCLQVHIRENKIGQ